MGFVVLLYDPLSQGERLQYPNPEGVAQPKGCCQEQTMMGNQMALIGQFFGNWRVWDGIRGLDYLLSRPEVDASRVGVTGNSGGGTLSTYLTAMDDRFTMAAPSCFVTTYLADLENELPADSEQIPPGIIGAGLDHADFFVGQIPRPTLLLGQKDDYFDIRGTTQTFEELRRLYRILGAEDKVEMFIGPRGHGYYEENRQAMYRFFGKHVGVRGDTTERRPRIEKPETLFATPKGQVWQEGAKRVFDFTKETAQGITVARRPVIGSSLTKLLPRVLGLPEPTQPPHYRIIRPRYAKTADYPGCARFAVETEPSIQAILMHFDKQKRYFHIPQAREATLYAPHVSSLEDVEKGFAPSDLESLFALDVRGIGHTRALTCNDENFFAPYGNDYFYACHGDMLNEPYAGRRVHDLLAALDLLQSGGYRQVHLIGRGIGAITATFAACLHPLIKRVTLRNALLSFHEMTQIPVQSWPLSSLVRGVLLHLDLPDCYRLLRTKRLAIVEPWDSQMTTWTPQQLSAHVKQLGLDARAFGGAIGRPSAG